MLEDEADMTFADAAARNVLAAQQDLARILEFEAGDDPQSAAKERRCGWPITPPRLPAAVGCSRFNRSGSSVSVMLANPPVKPKPEEAALDSDVPF